MVQIAITSSNENTPIGAMIRMIDKCGLALLAYKPIGLEELLGEILGAVPRLQQAHVHGSGICESSEVDYVVYWCAFRTPGGSIFVAAPFARSIARFGGHFKDCYLDPLVSLEGRGYKVATAALGDVADELVACQLQTAYM